MKEQLKWNSEKSEVRSRKSEVRRENKKVCLLLTAYCFLLFFISGCATPSANLPPPPPKYVQAVEDKMSKHSANSLWNDSANIFEDTKARRLNDLVMISIAENLSGSGTADTNTSRDSSAEYNLTNLLGMNNDFNLHNAFLLKDLFKGSNIFDPSVAGDGKSEFKGKGDTNREGNLVANITAKVVEVMPNGNLVLEARKELTINNEKQLLVLTGTVRPNDIDSNNTVLSSKIADAQIYYVGDGVIQDKQSPGWLVRIMDNIWPF
jgi:flagellar L-ring protein precursor FlgH